MYHHKSRTGTTPTPTAPTSPAATRWPDALGRSSDESLSRGAGGGRQGAARASPTGERPRNRFDLFLPDAEPKGLVVFIHGGYWTRFDQSFWSHLAKGRWPTVMRSPCRPTRSVRKTASPASPPRSARRSKRSPSLVGGPIHLTGHSAGGHLATRMVSTNAPLSEAVKARIRNVVSISGLHDLRLDDAHRHERRRSASTMPRRWPKVRSSSSRSESVQA